MKYINKIEASELLQVSEKTIKAWCEKTNIPRLALNNREVYYLGKWRKLPNRFNIMRNLKYVFEKNDLLKWYDSHEKWTR